jgi:hypothetical protein
MRILRLGRSHQLSLPTEFCGSDEFPRTLQQHYQQQEGLRLQPQSYSLLSQFAGTQVCFDRAKLEMMRCGNHTGHNSPPTTRLTGGTKRIERFLASLGYKSSIFSGLSVEEELKKN